MCATMINIIFYDSCYLPPSAGAVEYTDCYSAER